MGLAQPPTRQPRELLALPGDCAGLVDGLAQGRKVGAGHLARVSKPLDKPPHRVDWV
jgi:hypothetical protein